MTNFMLRGLTADEVNNLDALAHNAHVSRQEYVLTLIRAHIGDNQPHVVGMVEVTPTTTCRNCDKSASRIVYYSTGAFSWLCDDCAAKAAAARRNGRKGGRPRKQ